MRPRLLPSWVAPPRKAQGPKTKQAMQPSIKRYLNRSLMQTNLERYFKGELAGRDSRADVCSIDSV